MSEQNVKEWEKWFKQFDPVLKDVTRPQERGFRDFVSGRPAPTPPPPTQTSVETEQNNKEDEKV